MKPMHAMMLAHNTIKMCAGALENFSAKATAEYASKTIVDQRYPLALEYDQAHDLLNLAYDYGWDYVRPKFNRGVGGSWNWFINELDLLDGEILLGVDPDGRPVQKGWDLALQDVLSNDPTCLTAQLNVAGTYACQLARREIMIGNTMAIDYHDTCAWTMGAFDVGWLRKIGGFLQGHPQYGFCEIVMNNRIRPMGGRALIVRDFYDEHLKAEDQLYTNWKLACAQQRTQKSFNEWLTSPNNG